MGKKGDELREAAELADQEEALREQRKRITDELKSSWLSEQPISSHTDIEKKFAEEHRLTLSDARKHLSTDLKKYEIEGRDVPALIKELKDYRRTLKGEEKIAVTKSISNLINSYSDHLDKSIDKIYWLRKYKPALKDMSYNEENIIKLSMIREEDIRRQLVDSLCKYWEDKLERNGMPFNAEYARLTKGMTNSKREFKDIVNKYMVNIGPKEILKRHITRMVCEEQGISSRQIYERLPDSISRKTSPSMISWLAKSEDITNVNGALYKMSHDIKKDIYAYTAAFIDSDGYITMDKNHNPRVGLVATGDRGKAFMLEMKKSLGIGRLHLDQKSPQDTKPINRLNFYSQAEVTELLTKCLPHFKLKRKNADILLELMRMKKSHKKASWYNARKTELFKLMKYENHKDDKNYDFGKYNIDIDNVAKYYDNNKTSEMDKLESIVKNEDE
tara:strand:+ start:931 stop:2268 length:1338 start_codon:yes stop_codon:yes gene_type:complete